MNLWEKFVELVKHHFAFLESDFKFERKEAKPPFIFYESDKLQVGIYYGEWQHELDLSIRKLGDDPSKVPSIGIGALMLLTDWREAEKYRSPFPSTERDLEIEVPRLAELIRKYGFSILKGEEQDFERLGRLAKERLQEINKQVKQNQMRNRLNR